MGWPFSSVAAPTFESSPGVMAVPTSNTAVPNIGAGTLYIQGLLVVNTNASVRTLTITDTAGNEVFPGVDIPGKSAIPYEFPFLPLVGLSWSASAVGLKAKVWGYK